MMNILPRLSGRELLSKAEWKRGIGYLSKRMAEAILESVLTCPECGHPKREVMPTAACQFFYECESCKTVLRPKPGDCCVFCS